LGFPLCLALWPVGFVVFNIGVVLLLLARRVRERLGAANPDNVFQWLYSREDLIVVGHLSGRTASVAQSIRRLALASALFASIVLFVAQFF